MAVTSVKVQVDVEPELLAKLLTRVRTNWERLGSTEPHWSVLTNPEFKADRIGQTEKEFYDSGAMDRDLFRSAAARCAVELPADGTCFELGCGVGRITLWLAESFKHVIAADVSAAHLKVAENIIRRSARTNIELRLLNSPEAVEQLPMFDAFYSLITLQHNPPPVMRWLLGMILSRLTPGGLGFFQVPTMRVDYRFDAAAYLASPISEDLLEMHILPQEIILDVLAETGCHLLEARELDCIGDPLGYSQTFLVRRTKSSIPR